MPTRNCCLAAAAFAALVTVPQVLGFTAFPGGLCRPSTASAASAFRRHTTTSGTCFSVVLAASDAYGVKEEEAENNIPTEWRGQVLSQLRNVIDPDLGTDIVTLGFVKKLELDEESRTVSFHVELTTPACPVKDQFASDCQRLVEALPWISKVHVTMTSQETVRETDTFGMKQVGAVIAVSSCKGGVGKSTTAVNLAFSLQSIGATVGIFDADIYGPSLPTMVTPDDDIVRFVGRQIAPLQRNGVRLMSFGYVNDGSAVMRGPMVTQLLDQFLSVTQWGQLDYLIIDMPPGTGDIQLTLTQKLNITAAVIVTTPQELSFADVVRGVEMFDSVNVPCVAVVENMAYYEVDKGSTTTSPSNFAMDTADCDALKAAMLDKLQESGIASMSSDAALSLDRLSSDLVQVVVDKLNQKQQENVAANNNNNTNNKEQIRIFGAGHKQRLSEQFGIEHSFSIPLLDRIASNGDSGMPFVLGNPDSPQTAIYQDLAKAVVTEVAKAKYSVTSQRPRIVYDKEEHVIVVNGGGRLSPSSLRKACRCAACVEELTGRQILIPSMISDNITPLRMNPTGNYALSIDWSDGHRSLYPYRQIQAMLPQDEPTTATAP